MDGIPGRVRVLVREKGHTDLAQENSDLRAEVARLRGLIGDLAAVAKQAHYACDDSWYSCPKSPEGCLNEEVGEDCICGADKINAKIAEIVEAAKGEK